MEGRVYGAHNLGDCYVLRLRAVVVIGFGFGSRCKAACVMADLLACPEHSSDACSSGGFSCEALVYTCSWMSHQHPQINPQPQA